MKYIALPSGGTERLTFYLAQEEYIARYLKDDDCFFMWQVEPTVIFGRNQLIENEVNLSYCKENNIQMYRRKSGGGCVYADMNNVMFSYINSGQNVCFTFDKYVRLVAYVLRQLGLDAHSTGRNDILIDGKKVSGNAFYHIPGRNIVHGTMLFDTNMRNMVGSITPSDEKLISKGVESVRQHITLLKDYLNISIEEFKTFVRTHLCDSEIMLSEEDVNKIREIEKEYLTLDFIYGNNPKYSITKNKRIEGCGCFDIRIELKNGVIRSVNIMGDYFLTGDMDKGLLDKLRGCIYNKVEIEKRLEGIDTSIYVMNLKTKDFVNLLTE